MQPRNIRRQRVLIWVAVAVVVFTASVVIFLRSPGMQRLLQGQRAPHTILNLVNQQRPPDNLLPITFQASRGTIKIYYVCRTHIGIGTGPDVTFFIVPQNGQLVWNASLVCPDGKEDEITVEGGTYRLGVEVNEGADAGWGVTIIQE